MGKLAAIIFLQAPLPSTTVPNTPGYRASVGIYINGTIVDDEIGTTIEPAGNVWPAQEPQGGSPCPVRDPNDWDPVNCTVDQWEKPNFFNPVEGNYVYSGYRQVAYNRFVNEFVYENAKNNGTNVLPGIDVSTTTIELVTDPVYHPPATSNPLIGCTRFLNFEFPTTRVRVGKETVGEPDATSRIGNSNSITISPNPARTPGVVALGIKGLGNRNYTIQILDNLGRVVAPASIRITGQQVYLHLGKQAPGLYRVRIVSAEGKPIANESLILE